MNKEELLSRLEEFKSLKKGWDSYDSKTIRRSILKRAYEEIDCIIAKFKAIGFSENKIFVVPCPHGGIQFEAEETIGGDELYFELEMKRGSNENDK